MKKTKKEGPELVRIRATSTSTAILNNIKEILNTTTTETINDVMSCVLLIRAAELAERAKHDTQTMIKIKGQTIGAALTEIMQAGIATLTKQGYFGDEESQEQARQISAEKEKQKRRLRNAEQARQVAGMSEQAAKAEAAAKALQRQAEAYAEEDQDEEEVSDEQVEEMLKKLYEGKGKPRRG